MTNHVARLPKSTFSFIFYFVRQQWMKFALITFCSIVWAINDTIFPYFLKRIVNALENYNSDPKWIALTIGHFFILIVLFWILTEFFLRLQGILQVYTFPKFRSNIRNTIFDYVKSHSHEYFSNHFAGNLAKKII